MLHQLLLIEYLPLALTERRSLSTSFLAWTQKHRRPSTPEFQHVDITTLASRDRLYADSLLEHLNQSNDLLLAPSIGWVLLITLPAAVLAGK
jgi:hypothetical protein